MCPRSQKRACLARDELLLRDCSEKLARAGLCILWASIKISYFILNVIDIGILRPGVPWSVGVLNRRAYLLWDFCIGWWQGKWEVVWRTVVCR